MQHDACYFKHAIGLFILALLHHASSYVMMLHDASSYFMMLHVALICFNLLQPAAIRNYLIVLKNLPGRGFVTWTLKMPLNRFHVYQVHGGIQSENTEYDQKRCSFSDNH
jgi:hypothetical protein